jgi:hypothetical protein
LEVSVERGTQLNESRWATRPDSRIDEKIEQTGVEASKRITAHECALQSEIELCSGFAYQCGEIAG